MEGDVVMHDVQPAPAADTEMPDKPSTASHTVTAHLSRALAILIENGQHPKPTICTVAKALCNRALPILSVYRAASCMREGVLKELVQMLIFERDGIMPALRLLNVMRGLPGNWELALELLEERRDEFAKLEQRAWTMVAFLGGRKAFRVLDWSDVFGRAVDDDEASLAVHMVAERKWGGEMENVYHIWDWEEEMDVGEVSFWREVEWAHFARGLCLRVAVRGGGGECFEVVGEAKRHYVRVGGVLMRRRGERREGGEVDCGEVVVTESVKKSLRDVAKAVCYGVPVLLEGNTGCGKTTIVSFLARMTMYDGWNGGSDAPNVTFVQMDSTMRESDGDAFASLIGSVVPLADGGGFQWRPGPIGRAVEKGHWLVLENIGSAAHRKSSAVPVIMALANLGAGDALHAPGRGAPLRAGRGFRCIATRTTCQGERDDTWEPPGGWDTWQRVCMDAWSEEDKMEILKRRFDTIRDCVPRVVKATEKVAAYVRSQRGVSSREPTLREAVKICERLRALRAESNELLTVENALLETLDVLAAWCPVGGQRKALVAMVSECWSLPVEIGESLYSQHRPNFTCTTDIVRIGRSSLPRPGDAGSSYSVKLALTGYTLRLLERSLRCLQVNEHVLLTGEAGSGKTSLVQELAKLVNKRLVVVNLSRQSEFADLVGGFRPLELAAAIPQLAKKFEKAFCSSMSRTKNERFLDALQRASRSVNHHSRAIRLMQGAMDAIPSGSRKADVAQRESWSAIAEDLSRLSLLLEPSSLVSDADASEGSSQPVEECLERPRKRQKGKNGTGREAKHSSGPKKRPRANPRRRQVEFQFCEGVLVQAMRAGDWLLLDEINLAPSELLESLVSILDRGQITLPDDRGAMVTQSAGFRLFGAMNPPTDVGKRPLPGVLRARFTELNAGDMLSSHDVEFLTLHRCFGVSSVPVSQGKLLTLEQIIAKDVARFFLECRKKGVDGHLEDFAGKPARFNLRNLCRMLDFASGLGKYVSRSAAKVRRILFEGAMLAFATPLNAESRVRVAELASSILLVRGKTTTSCSEILSNMVSLPPDMRARLCSVEGFPVLSKHTNPPRPSLTEGVKGRFVLTPTVRKTLQDVSRALVIGTPSLPVLLQGPTAAGKTSLVAYIAELTGNKLIRINNHEHTELSEYLGGYVVTPSGSLVFHEGPLVHAARTGSWILLDELNLAPPDVLESLNRLLDDNREIFIAETGETVHAVDGFMVFATQNPPGLYGGRKELSRAFRSRFVEVQVPDLPDQDLRTILENRCRIPQSFARDMIKVMRQLQMRRRTSSMFSGKDGFVTARDLFRWASRGPRSKAELAVHGFFLLGERSRRAEEKAVVRNEILKAIGVDEDVLSDQRLYAFEELENEKSPAQECLDFSLDKLGISKSALMEAMRLERLVSTLHTRRMLTLLIHGIASCEPCLLVGETGGGKTSCCAVISRAMKLQLLTVNCHRHTEASDILGSFRPVRRRNCDQLFEWVDGPLIEAMKKGCVTLIDEINMADDAVIERMNSVLELERMILLSEKGTVSSNGKTEHNSLTSEVITAHESFRLLATMNPGGDFGKRELSPALRNRFTEVWVPAPCTIEEYSPIIHHRLSLKGSDSKMESVQHVSKAICQFIEHSLSNCTIASATTGTHHRLRAVFPAKAKNLLSIRDVSTWCDFIRVAIEACKIHPFLAMLHGARLVFLDGLSVGGLQGSNTDLERNLWELLTSFVPPLLRKNAQAVAHLELQKVDGAQGVCESSDSAFVFGPFTIVRNSSSMRSPTVPRQELSYSFSSPATSRNCARLARAMSTGSRPILLEGPPGCGKSSLIAAVADRANHSFVRINLSDATEMSDLIGTDCPGDEPGKFSFREGPLLSALRVGSWVLLDELNLASQSVLEGLNSTLDHRRSLYVSEINKEVHAHESFRVFGAQNPATDGGGRRGLPKSFLNRFTRVQIEAPGEQDVQHIVMNSNPLMESRIAKGIIRLLFLIHDALKRLGYAVDSSSFGLRDALRWCDLLTKMCREHEASAQDYQITMKKNAVELSLCFDVVVLQGLRSGNERKIAEDSFVTVFGYEWDKVKSLPVVGVSSNGYLRVGHASLKDKGDAFYFQDLRPACEKLSRETLRAIQALCLAVRSSWPTVLYPESAEVSQRSCRNLVKTVARLHGKALRIVHGGSLADADEFIGGYTQKDLSRLIHQILQSSEDLLLKSMGAVLSNGKARDLRDDVNAFQVASRELFKFMNSCKPVLSSSQFISDSMISELTNVLDNLCLSVQGLGSSDSSVIGNAQELLSLRAKLSHMLLMRRKDHIASFEWVKSELLRAVETGEWILIDYADHCPPAVLDRLNPILERPPMSLAEMESTECDVCVHPVVLAEAPSDENGKPVVIRPNPAFRVFLSCSSNRHDRGYGGLSRAILDRSLKIAVGPELFKDEKDGLDDFRDLIIPTKAERDDLETFSSHGAKHFLGLVEMNQIRRYELSSGHAAENPTSPGHNRAARKCINRPIFPDLRLMPVPSTYDVDLALNPPLNLVNRDLVTIQAVHLLPIDALAKLRLPTTGLLVQKDVFKSSSCNDGSCSEQHARDLIEAGAVESFLLAAQSPEDLIGRTEVIVRKRRQLGSAASREVCEHAIAVGKSLSVTSASKQKEQSATSLISTIQPMDPIYAGNMASASLLRRERDGRTFQTVTHLSKLFRLEVLALHAFRSTWEEALNLCRKGHSERELPITRARMAFEIAERGLELPSAGHILEVVSYGVLLWAADVLGLILRVSQESKGWELCGEHDTIRLFRASRDLCKTMMGSRAPSNSELASRLLEIRDLAIGLKQKCYGEHSNMFELPSSLTTQVEGLERSIQGHCSSLMPKTERGQELEKLFIAAGLWNRRSHFRDVDVDAFVKGMASVSISAADDHEGMFHVLQNVTDHLLKQHPADGAKFIEKRDWTQTVNVATVNLMQKAARLFLQFGRCRDASGSKQIEDILKEFMSFAKCASYLQLSSVIIMQQAKWVVERCDGDWASAKDDVLNQAVRAAMMSTVLGEKAYVMRCYIATEDETSQELRERANISQGEQVVSGGEEALSRFWNLPRNRLKAVATVSDILTGNHLLHDSVEDSTMFLQASLSSVMSFAKMISSPCDIPPSHRATSSSEHSLAESREVLSNSAHSVGEVMGDLQAAAVSSVADAAKELEADNFDLHESSEAYRSLTLLRNLKKRSSAWILIGLLRLRVFQKNMENGRGIDPSEVAQSSALLHYDRALKASAKVAGYVLLSRNRLGGDAISQNVPIVRVETEYAESMDHVQKAMQRYVHRPSDQASYSSFASMVNSLGSSIIDRISITELISPLVTTTNAGTHGVRSTEEANDLYLSCVRTDNALEIAGSFSHFRDLSAELLLGLRELQVGLSYYLRVASIRDILSDATKSARLDLFRNLTRFPRAAVVDACPLTRMLEECTAIGMAPNAMMACADYLVDNEMNGTSQNRTAVSELFDFLVHRWKKRALAEERKATEERSLHVLLEISRREDSFGNAALRKLETDEEEDYVAIFNPISEELEDVLLGLSQESEKTKELRGSGADEALDNCERATWDSHAFWKLHEKVFRPDAIRGTARADLEGRVESMRLISSEVFAKFDDVKTAVNLYSGPWDLFNALSSIGKLGVDVSSLSGRPDISRMKDAKYNFYTDANPNELLSASSALWDLYCAITRIQREQFSDTGEHPVLAEVAAAIKRLGKHSTLSTPLPKVIIGIENVLRKVDEWRRLFAVARTRMDAEVSNLAKVVARWRRIEMTSWGLLLDDRVRGHETRASKWFFYLYDAILREGLSLDDNDDDSHRNAVSAIDLFLRSAPIGEFESRLRMIQSLGAHMLSEAKESPQHSLGFAIRSVGYYYALFEQVVSETKTDTVEKAKSKLEEISRLVSWNTASNLEAGLKMSKEKQKYLEYYRLKASSERTKRRLHKLCLEIDSSLQASVYDSLTKEIRQIGFTTLGKEEDERDVSKVGKERKKCKSSLDKLHEIVKQLHLLILPHANEAPTESAGFITKEAEGRLSKLTTYMKKLRNIGREISQTKSPIDIAVEVSKDIRVAVRARALALRESKELDIQVKKRALVQLLKVLQSTGLSPHEEKSRRISSWSWLSTPEPSICKRYNQFAGRLFFECARQVNRLHEATDSRVRSADITLEEGRRSRAFCNDLLSQACSQRKDLYRFISDAVSVATLTSSIQRHTSQFERIQPSTMYLKEDVIELSRIVVKVRRVCIDFEALQVLLQSAIDLSRKESFSFQPSSCEESLLRKQFSRGCSELLDLRAILDKSIVAIKEFLSSSHVGFVENEIGGDMLMSANFNSNVRVVHELLMKLAHSLGVHVGAANEIGRGNVVSTVLAPTVSFLQKSVSSLDSAIRRPTEQVDGKAADMRSKLIIANNLLVEKVLIGAQNIMQLNNVGVNPKREQDSTLESHPLSAMLREKVLQDAHGQIASFEKSSNIGDIKELLNQIHANLGSYMSCQGSDDEKMVEVMGLHNQVANFLHEYMQSLIIPCIRKISLYHCYSLALLRTLSSLFTGICAEGFCRPEEHGEEARNVELSDQAGVGFGDVGDDDLSMAQDVSEQVEDEEQLLGLDGDARNENPDDHGNYDQEKGVEMTTDFDGELKNVSDVEEGEANEQHEEEEEMSAEGIGDNVVDEKLWDEEGASNGNNEEDASEENNTTANASSDLAARSELDRKKEAKDQKDPMPPQGLTGEKAEGEVAMNDTETSAEEEEGSKDSERKAGGPERENDKGDQGSEPGEQNEQSRSEEETHVPTERTERTDELQFDDADDRGNADVDMEDGVQTDRQMSDVESGEEPLQNSQESKEPRTANDDEHDNNFSDELSLDQGSNLDGNDSSDDLLPDSGDPTASGQLDENENEEGEDSGSIENVGLEESNEGYPPNFGNDEHTPGENEGNAVQDAEAAGKNTTGQKSSGLEAGQSAMFEDKSGKDSFGKPKSEIDAKRDSEPPVESGPGTGEKGSVPAPTQDTNSHMTHKAKDNTTGSEEMEKNYDNIIEPNPLRIQTHSELISSWSRYLNVIQEQSNPENGHNGNDDNESGQEWEFKLGGEENGNLEKLALGAATADQQKPLDVPEESEVEERNSSQEANPNSLATSTEKNVSPDAHTHKSHMTSHDEGNSRSPPRRDHEAVEDSLGNLETPKPHPARKAVERLEGEMEISSESHQKNTDFTRVKRDEMITDDARRRMENPGKQRDATAGIKNDPLLRSTEVLSIDEACGIWRQLNQLTMAGANELCEQLRLILEPNTFSALTGGYRTGKRLDIRKVIEFVASDFRKDRIWLRRMKPERRSYDVILAIDDSESMSESEAGPMAMEALAVVSSALAKLEIGRMGVASFGSDARLIRRLDEPLPMSDTNGGALLQHFQFSQVDTNISKLLELIQSEMKGGDDSEGVEHIKLALVISDGRLSNRDEIKMYLRRLRELNVLVAFIIVDKVEKGEAGIYDVRRAEYDQNGKVQVLPYMQDFPVEFHAVVQDVRMLPTVLADALRQWIEVMSTLS